MSDELITINNQLPAFLVEAVKTGGSTGLEEMREFLTPPRLKITQAMSKGEFKQFPVGTVLVTPTNEVVCGPQGYFAFTVLYAYSQFCVHNPYKRPEGMSLIRESTFDYNSEIAAKCRNFVSEPFPEDPSLEIKYATHINALIVVHGIPTLANVPVMLSQYMGEWKAGRRMLDLLNARTSDGTPIYAHNLMAHEATHKSGSNEWEGLDISNPTADVDVGRFVTAEQFAVYKQLHEQCKADKERFTIKYDDEVESEAVAVDSDTL